MGALKPTRCQCVRQVVDNRVTKLKHMCTGCCDWWQYRSKCLCTMKWQQQCFSQIKCNTPRGNRAYAPVQCNAENVFMSFLLWYSNLSLASNCIYSIINLYITKSAILDQGFIATFSYVDKTPTHTAAQGGPSWRRPLDIQNTKFCRGLFQNHFCSSHTRQYSERCKNTWCSWIRAS
jgi:hypothetical protein